LKVSGRERLKTLFVGFAVPDETMEELSRRDPVPQIAAHKFQWSIIRGVEEASGSHLDLLSSIPASDYPRGRKIFFGYRKWRHREESEDVLIPFVNVILLKHLSRLFFSLVFIIAWLYRHRNAGRKSILVYAMHSPYVLATLAASRILGGSAVLIIPDLPAFSDVGIKRGPIRRALKALDVLCLPWLTRKFDGLVVLSRHIAEDLGVTEVPYIVVEGAITESKWKTDGAERHRHGMARNSEIIVMYAGGLSEEYGLTLLLDAFSRIPDKNYRLWICGRGPLEPVVKDYSARDRRVVYWGFLPNEDVMEKERQSTVLVNARSSNNVFTRYSFPSKLLEFMLSARPTITTELPSIPDEYKDFLFLLKEETPEKLAGLIREVCSRSPEDLSDFGRKASEFVLREKNYRKQGERIYDLLARLSGDIQVSAESAR